MSNYEQHNTIIKIKSTIAAKKGKLSVLVYIPVPSYSSLLGDRVDSELVHLHLHVDGE